LNNNVLFKIDKGRQMNGIDLFLFDSEKKVCDIHYFDFLHEIHVRTDVLLRRVACKLLNKVVVMGDVVFL
jgi:hypothetical protein